MGRRARPGRKRHPESFVNPAFMPRNRLIKDPERYKTVLCEKWVRLGECPYGRKCQFAHGEEELRERTCARCEEAPVVESAAETEPDTPSSMLQPTSPPPQLVAHQPPPPSILVTHQPPAPLGRLPASALVHCAPPLLFCCGPIDDSPDESMRALRWSENPARVEGCPVPPFAKQQDSFATQSVRRTAAFVVEDDDSAGETASDEP